MSNLKDSIENLKKITSEEETEIYENAEESHSVNVEALHNQKPTFYEVIIQKDKTSTINYNKVEGQFLFISMDSSTIPENYTIYSDYEPGKKLPILMR